MAHPSSRAASYVGRSRAMVRRCRPGRRPGLGALVVLSVAALGSPIAQAGEALSAPVFSEQAGPLLRERCGRCHGQYRRLARLNLSSAEGLARGGESGPALVPGDVASSLLWQRIEAEDMPPGEPLAASERELIRGWIAAGAPGLPDPSQLPPGDTHWAFQPPRTPPLPEVADPSRVQTAVDRFIMARLEAQGWHLAPPADRATLLRRVALDVTGLPPTLAEQEAFLSDTAPGAVPRMIERYLASPHYGERWGKYWLDAVGYADSNGYFNADSDRPWAWRYRDYVVRSHNADRPWNEFLEQQIAGDELAGYTPGGDLTPEMVDSLLATHFLRNAPDGTGESDGNEDEVLADRFAVIEGTVQIMGSALLGLTVQCARCHDHKFEPLTQREYYGLQAILWAAYQPDDWRKPAERLVAEGTVAERAAHQARLDQIAAEVEAVKKRFDQERQELVERLREERLAGLEPSLADQVRVALATAAGERSEDAEKLLAEQAAVCEVSDEQLAERFTEYGPAQEAERAEIEKLEASRPAPLEQLAILTDVARQPPPHFVRERGQYRELGEEALPGVPAALVSPDNGWNLPAEAGASGSGRRLALARWLTSPEQPTVRRLLVNRVWQQHFGQGLFTSPDNLGYTGAEPSHPELLDYLAAELPRHGWSLKWLHREILNSATYQQSSQAPPGRADQDPENRLLSHFSLRRLDAEALRDSLLALSGRLDHGLGGPYVPTERDGEGAVVVDENRPGAHRRSLYLQQRRTQVNSFLELFDAPSLVTNCTRRSTSTVPLQALALMNAPLVRLRSQELAKRLMAEAPASDDARIERLFRLAICRPPRAEELAAAQAFFKQAMAESHAEDHSVALAQVAWTDFCQALLASSAFLYVE